MTALTAMRVGLALAAAGLGCAAGTIPAEQLPGEPIAFVYRTPEQGRRRAELLARREERAVPASGVARLDEVGELFGSGRLSRAELRELAGRVALLDPRTGRVRVLESTPRGSVPLAWSPDGERLLFVSAMDGPAQLHEVVVRTGDVRALTRGPAAHPSGCYAGRRLVYTESRDTGAGRTARIFVREPGPDPPRPLSPGPADAGPACSPDGRTVLYVSAAPGGGEAIFRVPVRGGEPRRLGAGRQPAFTPEGEWVVYTATSGGRSELRRMRADGTGKTRIGGGVTQEHWPSPSPGGVFVVYESEEREREDLWVRRFDGSSQRVLLDRGDGAHPVWSPGAQRRLN